MILLCGIPSEAPLRMIASRLEEMSADFVLLNQRDFAKCDLWFEIESSDITGELKTQDRIFRLEDFTGIYPRLMDDRLLPELMGEADDSPLRAFCRGFHDTLIRWMEIAPACVINRCAPMASNSSKPYQAQLIRQHGFYVPETLITNDPQLVREFRKKHGRIIYKSISAIRSIVQQLDSEDEARLEQIRWCPTQFQAYVDGVDVRVHTINGEAFATAIDSDATDYRYAGQQSGRPAGLREVELCDELKQKCIGLTQSLGLEFAGIDLRITPEDEVYCFEANPSPAFSYYESHTGQPISQAVAHRLASRPFVRHEPELALMAS
ncbi:RimK family alpha-L-glutamate ligase [Acidicapsa dinghuensis]|uniref:RimK family alpha-L-glutamate ligase n=1 Tax=Acidicapsa dinghuensis TaxID=2218256 RepID=A0ABW1ECL9_9BACT|nr:hypothetical protein [Acidicapsa dinghuensis]